MGVKITCPSCNQHISADTAMRGRVIACPSCGESIKVEGKATAGSGEPLSVAKQILITVAVLYTIAAVWVTWSMFSSVYHRIHADQVRANRRARVTQNTTANNQANGRPRFGFLTNEMWVKPYNGDLAGVKEILDKNPQRLEERIGGMRATMLNVAAYGGQPDVVTELLRRGADVNTRTSQGHMPLYDCVQGKGTVEVAKILLDNKADYTIADNAGKTPLQLAVERNKTDIADLLRQSGATK